MSSDGSASGSGHRPVPLNYSAVLRFLGWSALGLCLIAALCTVLAIALARTTTWPAAPGGLGWFGGAPEGNESGAGSALWDALRGGLLFAAEIGAQVAGLVLPVAAVWLALRRAWALAIYVAVTGLGVVVLSRAVEPLVVAFTAPGDFTTAAGGNFPNSVALGMMVFAGAFLLVFLPAISPPQRAAATVLSALVIVVTGLLAAVLQQGAVSSVLAGWLLGILWLGVTAWGFCRFRAYLGLRRVSVWRGLMPEDRLRLIPAPAQDAPVAAASHPLAKLAGVAVVLAAILVTAGFLITEVFEPVQRFDQAVSDWFASIHHPTLSNISAFIGELGDTAGIIAVLMVTIPLSLAITGRSTPAAFLAVLAVGETALYLAVSSIVGRSRPVLEQASGLPPTASFPSGHTAASVVTYGGIALLLVAWSRSRWRYASVPMAVLLALGVGLSRLYEGVHYPTDTIFSVLYALVWLAVCWYVFRPDRAAPLNPKADDDVHHVRARGRPGDTPGTVSHPAPGEQPEVCEGDR